MSDDERERRIRALLPAVKQIARRVQRMVPGADLDDLIGDGSIGLLRAVDGYDPVHGVPLEQYARRVIVGAMLNGIRRLDPVSERVRRTLRVAEIARYELAQELGRLPSVPEMERRLPAFARARTEAHRGTPLSLDAPFPAGERLVLDRSVDPQEVVATASERRRIRGAVARLSPRQREIVVAHYFRERSLRSLGEALGISAQRVSQLHLGAIRRLRTELANGA
jgi:RNA polymerase sigma factor for flagellar operon FliA